MAGRSTPRYGIAEWFGKDITSITPDERKSLGSLAASQDQTGKLNSAPVCPFLSTLVSQVKCNKASGVCSIRRYNAGENGSGIVVPNDRIVTVCPSRFLQPLDGKKSVFGWIAEKMLDISNPTIIKETPFLRKVNDTAKESAQELRDEAEEEGRKAGRIDWILVNPKSLDANELEWCAVETQALYFSGDKMRPEFDAYASSASPVLFPKGRRRPDYRSSGPKRLAPQLDVKVPVLRNWGKKVVVVIDRYFFECMNKLADAYPKAKTDQARRDNSDVVWFVLDYNENMQIVPFTVVYTSLDSSRMALNATEPLSKSDFTKNLKTVISDSSRLNKVFKTSE